MKVSRIIPLLGLLLCVFLHTSCEKGPFDYRKKYKGNYTVTCKTTSWDISGGSQSSTTVLEGVVGYDKKSRNEIVFHFSTGDVELDINKHGVLYLCGQTIGRFKSKNQFYFTFGSNTCGAGGLGGGGTFEYTGIKK